MATLEKIRSKSVLLVVIIAVALLAFILGDAITNGRNLFGNNTTVAKVGKDKIEIQEYQRKHQELAQQIEEARRNNPQQPMPDSQVIPQIALSQLVANKLLNNAVEAVGIKASPEILRFFMIENPQYIPEMQQLVVSMNQNGISVNSPEAAFNAIFQPQSYGLTERQVEPYQRAWLAMETKYAEQIAQMMYGNLLAGSFKASKADIAAARNNYVSSAKVKVAKKPFGELSEKEYPVSDDEIKQAYQNKKEAYAIEEKTKEIGFLAVAVNPSAKDQQAAEVLATTVVAELKADSISKKSRQQGLDIQSRIEMRAKDIRNPMLKAFLDSAAPGSVAKIMSPMPGFMVAKLFGRSQRVDSVMLSTIQVEGNDSLVKEVLAYANSGKNLDSIGNVFPKDKVLYRAAEWKQLYSENGAIGKNLGLQESLYDSLYNTNGSYMVIQEVEGAAMLGTISKKSSPKEVIEYETVSYELQPSDATLADARAKLQKFIDENNTAEKFEKNAKAAGYDVQNMTITPSTPAIQMGFNGYYPDSRAVVRWVVMDGKDGEVSKIYQDKDAAHPMLYVAAIYDTYEDYIPWDNKDVKEELTAQVRREKAGKKLAEKYSKGSVEASAKAMNVEPVEIASLQAGKYDPTVSDSKVKGRILGSKPNKVETVSGDDGVYVFVVTGNTKEKVELTDDNFAQMFVNNLQINPQTLQQAAGEVLRGKKKIENNIYKFEQAE